jgi:hypothetical protein
MEETLKAWVAEPQLQPGEHIVWRRNANHERTALRQIGGRLFLTDRRLLFVPSRFDRASGGAGWECRLEDISDVGVEPAQAAVPFFGRAARLRRRLRLTKQDGSIDLFVVNGVLDAVDTLRGSLRPGEMAPD